MVAAAKVAWQMVGNLDTVAARKEWPILETDSVAIKNMAMGIALRAIRDLVCYRNTKKPKHKKIYSEVYSWMYEERASYADDPLDQIMSFEGICDILGWNPSWLRKRVKDLTPADLAKLGRNGGGGSGMGLIR